MSKDAMVRHGSGFVSAARKKEINAKISKTLMGHAVPLDQIEKQRKSLTGRIRPFSENESASLSLVNRPQTKPLVRKGATHWKSLSCRLVDPWGNTHDIHNISDFIRRHEDLFDPKDVEMKRYKISSGIRATTCTCNAQKRLSDLVRGNKGFSNGWKGWVVST